MMADEQPVTITVADPALAAAFERIAAAIPGAAGTRAGLDPITFLNVYAAHLEEAASVTLMTRHAPVTDPELD